MFFVLIVSFQLLRGFLRVESLVLIGSRAVFFLCSYCVQYYMIIGLQIM